MKAIKKIVDCPRCNEGDYRYVGLNICSLCECRFYVKGGRVVPAPESQPITLKCLSPEDDAHLFATGHLPEDF